MPEDFDQFDFEELLGQVEALNMFRSYRRVTAPVMPGQAAIEGEVTVADREVTLQMVLEPTFPNKLPHFFLRPWNALGSIPHVNQYGYICFTDVENLVLDRYRPIQIVQDAFDKARQVLLDGITGQNAADFKAEFEVYWERMPEIEIILSVLEPGDKLEEISIALDQQGILKFVGTRSEIEAFGNGETLNSSYNFQPALYLPLEQNYKLSLPNPGAPFWNAKQARRILLAELSSAQLSRLRKLLKRRTYPSEYVIVKLPRQDGGASLFGLRYDGVVNSHPLLEGGHARKLTPLHLTRWERSYIVQRGGGSHQLAKKRVLLVGCGAVGGFLAVELARAGITDLTLIDFEGLSVDNTFRHILGRRYWGKNKAEALKAQIEEQLPYVQIKAIATTIENAIKDKLINPGDYDLVVLALGSPTIELKLNEWMHHLPKSPRLLFTWLEPLGIGGHALLTGNNEEGGCFECLYTSPVFSGFESDQEQVLEENRAAFAAPGQFFGKALNGCGSLYTPYGSADASRTANLAVRLALDALTGKESGNPLLSWKEDASLFEAQGYTLSNRYGQSTEKLWQLRYTYPSPHCRVCCSSTSLAENFTS